MAFNMSASDILPAVYSFIASIAFGIQFNIRRRHIWAAGLGGFLCQLLFSMFEALEIKEELCYFWAAVIISVFSELAARKLSAPNNMFLIVSIIPLVPGRYVYDAMITLVKGNTQGFLHQAFKTFGIAGAIAMGVFTVSAAVRLLAVTASVIYKRK